MLINLLNNIETFNFEKFIVNDINRNIINFYTLLRDKYKYIEKNLKQVEKQYNSFLDITEKEKYYYHIRDIFNKNNSNISTVYFIFLMKTGFNGVYRENKKGEFNVPFGKKEHLCINYENLEYISRLIQRIDFYNLEYKDFFKLLEEKRLFNKAFLYCDPPYLPEDESINQKQALYTKDVFDHEEFVDVLKSISATKYMISMADSKRANEIYGGLKKYTTKELIRTINPQKGLKSTELLFSNYDIKS